MSRRLVIGICCVNALLGAVLLWLILTPRKPFVRNGLPDAGAREAKSFSAEELTRLKEFRPATPEEERLVRAMLQPK